MNICCINNAWFEVAKRKCRGCHELWNLASYAAIEVFEFLIACLGKVEARTKMFEKAYDALELTHESEALCRMRIREKQLGVLLEMIFKGTRHQAA